MKLNRWWEDDPTERFWIESTDRDDLGLDVRSPQHKHGDVEYWSYSLILEMRPGDVVYHYYKPSSAIIARSVVSGECRSEPIRWAAQGTAARQRGEQPFWRPGWVRDIDAFTVLPKPVTIADVQRERETLLAIRSRIEEAFGTPYFPFELSPKRPSRGLQGYLFKLPAAVVELFGLESLERRGAGVANARRLGQDYRPSDEKASPKQADPFAVDPDRVDRATQAHARLQNEIADYARNRGATPRSPAPEEPLYDVAWSEGETCWVVEVKSVTEENEERQLRLGLGQALRYRQALEGEWTAVQAVLFVERAPTDSTWTTLCDELGVKLWWPDALPSSQPDGDLPF